MKFQRLATFIDKYGIRKGAGLYTSLKLNRVNPIKVPGISQPLYLRKGTSDMAIFDQIFLLGEYDISLPFQPEIIVDAGANVGLFAATMKNRFPQTKMICIEPDQDNYNMLEKNVKGYTNVELIRAGLWHSNTRLDMADRYKEGHSALAVEENEATGNIPAITMDQLISDFSLPVIDLLKIDIETSEKELFSKNYEQWLPKVRVIIIELHDWLREGCSKTFFDAIDKTFRSYNYSICGENTIIANKDFQ
jgi:FkbM family methyltransferase